MTRVYRPRPPPIPALQSRFPKAPASEQASLEQRVLGLAKTGFVGIRNFDQGVVESLGAFLADDKNGQPKYWIKPFSGEWGDNAKGIPELPGVPVFFANPEDVNQDMKLPFVEVRRDDISPAMERWAQGNQQYRAPADGARPISVTLPDGRIITGYDRVEIVAQAIPYDITYTISVKARFRGAPGQRNQVNGIFGHVLRMYPPYGKINVVDSIGDVRGYEAFNEGISNLDNIVEVQDRVLGFAVTVRVEAELDSKDVHTAQTVRHTLTPQLYRL